MKQPFDSEIDIEISFPARISFSADWQDHGEITHIRFPAPFPELTLEQRDRVMAEINTEIQRIRQEQKDPLA